MAGVLIIVIGWVIVSVAVSLFGGKAEFDEFLLCIIALWLYDIKEKMGEK